MKTAGLLLAAGRSERFGAENKLLADLWGVPLVCHAAGALRDAGLDSLFAVTSDAEVSGQIPDFLCVSPDIETEDQSASMRAGIAAVRNAGADRVIVVLGDMPCISPVHLKHLLHHAELHDIVATTDGERRMPPACFRRSVFDRLLELSGDAGARALLRALPSSALQHADAAILTDVDRIEHLHALRKMTNGLSSGSDRKM